MIGRRYCTVCREETLHNRTGCVQCRARGTRNVAAIAIGREYVRCATCDPGPWRDGQTPLLTLHVDGRCQVCEAKANDGSRIERRLAKCKTTAQRLEIQLQELHTQKYLDRDGVWWHIGPGGDARPGPKVPRVARGRNAKNIARVLLRGKRRAEKLRASGALLTEVRTAASKRAGREWQRDPFVRMYGPLEARVSKDEHGRIVTRFYPASPGSAARKAAAKKATTTKRSNARRARALNLLTQGKTETAVAKKLGLDTRTIRRYKNGK